MEDLDGLLREFDRVVSHVSSGKGLMAVDQIAHLLAAWGPSTDVGENMRIAQQTEKYLRSERQNLMEACWQMLLDRPDPYRVEPAEARLKAEVFWAGLYWPGDIDGFNT